jgi:hypothetical protein
MTSYRIEHRTDTETYILTRTTDVHARQEELSQLAARLILEHASGEIVLVDEQTGEEVARRMLVPDSSDSEEDRGEDERL